jgi:hypothetical protein
MFDIEICSSRQVVLVRFRGQLTEDDFIALDRLAAEIRGGAEYDCIFDLSSVERVDLATDFVAKRGELPQIFKDRERIYVVPQGDLKLLSRLYASYQASKGWRPQVVVRALDEALSKLGVNTSDFRPLATGGSSIGGRCGWLAWLSAPSSPRRIPGP